MRVCFQLLWTFLLCAAARAEVKIWVEELGGKAVVNYRCTAGEVVRAFALDVTADKGQFVGISDFFTGPCNSRVKGYGIFPGSFRRFARVESGTNATWATEHYTPVAHVEDSPGGTLPGLNSGGVTLEMAALWDDQNPATLPNPEGTLCTLELTEPAHVSIAANQARGGVVSVNPEEVLTVDFAGAWIGPAIPRIVGILLEGETLTISFEGGELTKAESLDGPWVSTGNRLGQYTETIQDVQTRFYRVQTP